MSNNKSIQILRTDSDGVDGSNEGVILLDGQPFYNKQKNYLTIGHEENGTVTQKPITVREMVGYFDDNDEINYQVTYPYSIKPNGKDLEIKNQYDNYGAQQRGNILVQAKGAVNMQGRTCSIDTEKSELKSSNKNLISASTDDTDLQDYDESITKGNLLITEGNNAIVALNYDNGVAQGNNIIKSASGNLIANNNYNYIEQSSLYPLPNGGDNIIAAIYAKNNIIASNNLLTASTLNTITSTGSNKIEAVYGNNDIESAGNNTIRATGANKTNTIETTGTGGTNIIRASNNGVNSIEGYQNVIKAAHSNTIKVATTSNGAENVVSELTLDTNGSKLNTNGGNNSISASVKGTSLSGGENIIKATGTGGKNGKNIIATYIEGNQYAVSLIKTEGTDIYSYADGATTIESTGPIGINSVDSCRIDSQKVVELIYDGDQEKLLKISEKGIESNYTPIIATNIARWGDLELDEGFFDGMY